MASEEDKLEKIVQTRLLRLNATIHGIVFGLIGGSLIFVATIWLVIKGGPVVGPNLALLNQFFIGYKVTVLGSFVGFFYGFLTGFIVGFFIASVYNWILDLRGG
jgi:ABC-type amino acid transport system permease subunit